MTKNGIPFHQYSEAWEMRGKKKVNREDVVALLNTREIESYNLQMMQNTMKGGKNGTKSQ
ncbi:MAG: hypothetical protein KGI08_01935 [Thaumarchaeota archaeon]|nr:hypothetical protein [Nitrososphaerota archaeon]